MKVFITGAGGYLGSVLAAQLAKMPDIDSITGTVNNTLPRFPLPDKVNLIKMDIRSPEMADAMSGHDFVIHSAFLVHWSAKMPASVRDDINFNGTRNVAQAAVKNKVRGFIHASSISPYDFSKAQGKENLSEELPLGKGDSPMYYLNSKAIAEKILSEVISPSGISLTFLRMSYIIGPCNYVTIPSFRENGVLFPGINPRGQFVHENDVAQAFAQAIRLNMTGAFNVV
ncbi:MAG: NAD(P)-dependent oxidoreductase [Bacteroidota bacterium]